jgi:transposase-like protein
LKPPEGSRLLALCDGSKALQKAIKEQWPDVLLQECLVHVERHVLDRLKRSDRAEAMRLFKRLRLAHGSETAEQAYDELHQWLGKRHQGAQQSLTDAKERLLVVHSMELGEELQRSVLSTNAIENVMRNLRAHGHGVKRWRTDGTIVSRWMASGLMWLQRGFHPLRGHQAMPKLNAALAHKEA